MRVLEGRVKGMELYYKSKMLKLEHENMVLKKELKSYQGKGQD